MAAAYSASKAAVIALTKAIGKDLAGTSVLVNCIAPAVIETPLLAGMSEEHIRYMVEKIPMGRLGQRRRGRGARLLARERGVLLLHRRHVRHLRRAGPSTERARPRHGSARVRRRLGGEGRARGRRRAGRLRPRRRDAPPGAGPLGGRARRLTLVRGDITDLDALGRALDEHEITRVVHLAALQVPFCRADPVLGARVNVVGTVNVFEAVKERLDRIPGRRLRQLRRRLRPRRPLARAGERRHGARRRSTASTSSRTRARRASTRPSRASRRSGSGRTWSTGRGETRG